MKKIILIFALVGMVVFVVNPSSTNAGQVRGVTGDTIKIGAIVDQTGPGANASVPLTKAMRNLIRFTNEQGGIHGRKAIF